MPEGLHEKPLPGLAGRLLLQMDSHPLRGYRGSELLAGCYVELRSSNRHQAAKPKTGALGPLGLVVPRNQESLACVGRFVLSASSLLLIFFLVSRHAFSIMTGTSPVRIIL